jgi:hypothetical protein
MANKETSFTPYQTYLKNVSQINDFEELTGISYALSQQLLFKYPKRELPKIKHLYKPEILISGSYSMADVTTKKIKLNCKWITLQEFASKTKRTIEQVEKLISQNKLGPISKHPKSSERLVIWPQSYKNEPVDKLPAPGKSAFSANLEITASIDTTEDIEDMDNFENIQKKFLTLAHSLGKPKDVNKNSINILYRSCFLLHWTLFEVFLRSVLDQILIQNPELIFDDKQAEKLTITYKDLFKYSNKFSDINSLQSKLIENEIDKQEGDGKSIHGIINFIKSKLQFDKDPYQAWYQFKGKGIVTSYQSLIELKDVRNVLMHDAGFPNADFFTKYPKTRNRKGELIIDSDYYLNAKLTLRSIAYFLTKQIVNKKYKVAKEMHKK